MTNYDAASVDWRIPPGRGDWLMGPGTTGGERLVVGACALASAALVVAVADSEGAGWSWWQWLLVLVLAADVAGGVPANSLGTAKRLYHAPLPAGAPALQRFLRSPVPFAAAHVHPFVVALALPDASVGWAVAWYATSLVGTAAVVGSPLYLRRPLAAAVVAAALVAAPLVAAPTGLAWLGPLLVVKLVAAHAVREEPYRPVGTSPAVEDSTR